MPPKQYVNGLSFAVFCCGQVAANFIENNVCTRVANCFSAHKRVILVFINKHQNNTRVSPETVRHESTYIILFLTRHHESTNDNKSAKGAYTWSSPVCRSMCEGSEYMNLSVTKRKIILNVTISKLLVLVSMSGIWFGMYIHNISALV